MDTWEDAYDEFLKDLSYRPSQIFCWFNHYFMPGKLVVNLGFVIYSDRVH